VIFEKIDAVHRNIREDAASIHSALGEVNHGFVGVAVAGPQYFLFTSYNFDSPPQPTPMYETPAPPLATQALLTHAIHTHAEKF